MRLRILSGVLVTCGVLVGSTVPAAADTYVSPFIGLTFGGDAGEHAPVYGVAVSVLGRSAGIEIEYGHSPDFFGDGATGTTANVTTLSASYKVGGNPMGRGWRPYALTGVGLVRSRVRNADLLDDVSYNDFGLTFGAGVVGMLSSRVGIRGDLRYVRRLERQSDNVLPIASNFDFFRAAAALSVRF
jgi:hypothetical protein